MTMQQKWQRHEIKYRVTHQTLEDFKTLIQPLLEADPYGDGRDSYLNYSIYFDSPRYRFLNEKEEGLGIRTKPRLRVYKDLVTEEPRNYFFELKHRREALVLKERTRIDRDISLGILNDFCVPNPHNDPVLNRVDYLKHRHQIQPTLVVLYKRQAYSSPFYQGLRITYDSQISASLRTSLDTPRQDFSCILPPNETIIEIKYNQNRPNFISDIVHRLELRQISYSKYTESLQTLLFPMIGKA